jgi:hypothetical protein
MGSRYLPVCLSTLGCGYIGYRTDKNPDKIRGVLYGSLFGFSGALLTVTYGAKFVAKEFLLIGACSMGIYSVETVLRNNPNLNDLKGRYSMPNAK